jgi:hypothetical protein
MMTPEEKRDFGYALLVELLEGRIGTFSLNDWPLVLKSFFQGDGLYNAGYSPDEDKIYFNPSIIDADKALLVLFHEIGHRVYQTPDEQVAQGYAERKLREWKAMTDEEKRKKIVEGVLRLKNQTVDPPP